VDPSDITSQSNTLETHGPGTKGDGGGGKTPANKASKRAKNGEKKHGKGGGKEMKKGASSNKIFELQPTLQRSNTA
jgi:hypothetical protein